MKDRTSLSLSLTSGNKLNEKRFLVIAHNYYPNAVRERREIKALTQEGHETDLVCLQEPDQLRQENLDNLHIYRLPIGHKRSGLIRFIIEYIAFFLASLVFITYLQIRHRYSLVQVHNIPDFLVFTAWLPKIQGARILLDIRDPMPETYQYKFNLPEDHLLISFMRLIERVSIKFSDHVLTVHEPLRQIHIRRGCPPGKISVVMNLPDEEDFNQVSDSSWPRSEFSQFVLVYPGTLGERHGVHTALYGMVKLKQDIPGIKIQIIGDGEYLPELKRLSKTLGIDSIVSFVPPIPTGKISEILLQSDIGICLQEGLFGDIAFPTKVPEYFAMGLPAIVSKTLITSDFFDEKMVVFVPPGNPDEFSNAVVKLYRNTAHARLLINNGHSFLSNHNWHNERIKYITIVRNLTAR